MSALVPSLAPIAVFDSGLGGLSVTRHLRSVLPDESILYFGDCGWAPYGERAPEVILARTLHVGDWMAGQSAKAIVVACNTATTIAIAALRARHPELPIIGVEPGVKPAAALTRSGVVGVLATAATLRTPSLRALLARHEQGCRFVCTPGHGLVELIEAEGPDTPALDAVIRRHFDAMLGEGVDTVVLGSTHFPLLVPAIRRLYGDAVLLVESGDAVARRVRDVLLERETTGAARRGLPTVRLCSSAASPPLARLATQLLGAGPLTAEIHPLTPCQAG